MKQWVIAAHILKRLAIDDRGGRHGLAAHHLSASDSQGVARRGEIEACLAKLHDARLVERFWDVPEQFDQRCLYRITLKAHDLDEVVKVLFGDQMGASPVAVSIATQLHEVANGRWLPGSAIVKMLQVCPKRWVRRGPVLGMYWEIDRLRDSGLVERRGGNPGVLSGDYRIRLPWASSAGSPGDDEPGPSTGLAAEPQ